MKNKKKRNKPKAPKSIQDVLAAMVKTLKKENDELRSALSTACVVNQLMQHPQQICSVEFYIGDGGGKIAEIVAPELGLIGTDEHPILAVRPRKGGCIGMVSNGQVVSLRRQGTIAKGPNGFELIKATAKKAPAKEVPPSQKLGTMKFLPKCLPSAVETPDSAEDITEDCKDDTRG